MPERLIRASNKKIRLHLYQYKLSGSTNTISNLKTIFQKSSISEKTGMSWQTAKDYLLELQKKGYVNRRVQEKRTYWWLRT